MRHMKFKMFFAWEHEKEEKWLNEMSKKGLQLTHVGFGKYVFEENTQVQYFYQIELLENLPSNYESSSYIRFLEETGAEHVTSFLRWVYFRKNVTYGEFVIYSDVDSKIKHYKRILFMLLAVAPISVINVFNMFVRYVERHHTIFFILGVVSFVLVVLLLCGIYSLFHQTQTLKKEKYIKE